MKRSWTNRFGQSNVVRETSMQRLLDKRANAREVQQMRFLAKLRRGRDWHDREHKFQLRMGDTMMKATAVMTGREAHERNMQFEKKYIADVTRDKKTRLCRWIWLRDEKVQAVQEQVQPE